MAGTPGLYSASAESRGMILAGDIGGTKTNLALFASDDLRRTRPSEPLIPLAERRFSNRNYRGLEEVVTDFLSGEPLASDNASVTAAAFGLAGPVVQDACRTSNLPWVVRGASLRELLEVRKVRLVNDLVANGYGIALLTGEQLMTVYEGTEDSEGHGALIAAGTGLGEAILYREDGEFQGVASEGGHSTFAPRNELEIELLRYLLRKWDHVSFERLVSGPGLFNIYSFLKDTGRGQEPDWVRARIESGDPPAVVSEAAMQEGDPLSNLALDLFISIYGAEAGNLALKCKATGGLYVGGGIAPKIVSRLQNGAFREAFIAKGRMSSLLEAIPIRVIMEPRTALFGAGRCAALL